MYCPQCNMEGRGKYCWNCGALVQPESRLQPTRRRLPWILAGFGVLLVLAVALYALTPSYGLGTPVITDQVDPLTKAPGRPLKVVPTNTQVIYVSVRAHIKPRSTLSLKWYIEGSHFPQFDFAHSFTEEYNNYISPGFTLKGEAWPKGKYTVYFYVDGDEIVQAAFEVK